MKDIKHNLNIDRTLLGVIIVMLLIATAGTIKERFDRVAADHESKIQRFQSCKREYAIYKYLTGVQVNFEKDIPILAKARAAKLRILGKELARIGPCPTEFDVANLNK